ncbi:MAG: TonB-dependent receptor, partial [Bryobacteraceae bacterium]
DVNTANSVLASVAGIVNNATQSYNVTSQNSGFVAGAPLVQNLRLNNHAAYVSDTWKFSPRLTLIGGVRWEYFSPVSERDGLLIQPTLINNNAAQTLTGDATLNFAGRNLYNKDLNNFAPNVGFAWDVFGTGRTVVRGGYSIHFTNADVLEAVLATVSVNSGLVGTTTLNNLNTFASTAPKLSAPAFKIPITTAENFNNTAGQAVQGLIDPNLQSPYAQQYSFGIQQRVGSMTIEARFVGTHSVKDLRQIDFNQINVNQAGFLEDFKNARSNGLLASAAGLGFDPRYNAKVAGSVVLPFFNSLPSGGALTNSAVRTPILQNQIGSLAQTYQGAGFFPTNIPGFSYFPNPNTLYSSELTNLTSSNYNGLQLEARRALKGMQFQVSYAFSKALSDTSVVRGLDAQLDNNNHSIERARAPWDLTNAFKATHYIPLPFGQGHRLSSSHGAVNKLIGGWALSGFLNIQNGSPISFLSARGTLNRGARSAQNTVDTTLTLDGLKAITGVYKTGDGIFFVDPSRIGPNGAGVAADGAAPFAGQVFFNPGAGTVGSLQRRILNSPWVNDYNFALVKETRISERQSVQFRADFYNVFNHPTFAAGQPAGAPTDYNVNSLTFGRITTQYYSADGIGPRVVQFGLLYKF